MKVFMRGILVLGLAMACGSCGPAEDTGTEIEVSTTETGTPDRDTVINNTTTIVTSPDTVVQRDTVVKREVDTVVRTEPAPPQVSASERGRIDAWLSAHSDSLNQYGDPTGTVYTGGTPLFDERSGKTIDKYTYIVRQHPDKPWMNATTVGSTPRR